MKVIFRVVYIYIYIENRVIGRGNLFLKVYVIGENKMWRVYNMYKDSLILNIFSGRNNTFFFLEVRDIRRRNVFI